MKEIEILEGEKTKDSNKTLKLPTNFITRGDIEVDDIKIYVKQDVYNDIEEFSKEDTSREYGGILIGDYAEINGKSNVVISAFIEAKYTDASASTLTFTHESWNYIHEQQEKLYNEKKILGWQHTHPSYGIFLSNYDIFIQENFFNLPWQIAYVVDPISRTRGFFQWKNGKIGKVSGFYIFDDNRKKIKVKEEKSSEKEEKTKSISITTIVLMAILLISIVVLGIEGYNNVRKINDLVAINVEMTNENSELQQKIQQNNSEVQEAQSSNEVQKSDETQQKEQTQNEDDNSTKAAVKSGENVNETIKLKAYKVEAGDTLDKICENNNLDYSKDRDLILKINNIKNEDKIYFGQTLYLPVA